MLFLYLLCNLSTGSLEAYFSLLNLQLLEEINMGGLRADVDNGMVIEKSFI